MLFIACSLPFQGQPEEVWVQGSKSLAWGSESYVPASILLVTPQSLWVNHTPLQNYVSSVQFGAWVISKDPAQHMTSYHRVRPCSVLEGM